MKKSSKKGPKMGPEKLTYLTSRHLMENSTVPNDPKKFFFQKPVLDPSGQQL